MKETKMEWKIEFNEMKCTDGLTPVLISSMAVTGWFAYSRWDRPYVFVCEREEKCFGYHHISWRCLRTSQFAWNGWNGSFARFN